MNCTVPAFKYRVESRDDVSLCKDTTTSTINKCSHLLTTWPPETHWITSKTSADFFNYYLFKL